MKILKLLLPAFIGFFTFIGALHAEVEVIFPEGTKYLIYVKDIKNLEDQLRKSGILSLSSEYVDYIIDYVKEKQPALGFYKELKSMEGGSFIKSLIGEMTLVNVMNDNVVSVRMERSSSYFAKLMDLFNVKGSFNGYFVDFMGDKLILSRNKAAISFYKSSSGRKNSDIVLRNQLKKDPDILYYVSGGRLIHPWLDNLIVQEGGRKSLSVSLNIKKKSVIVFSSPKLTSVSGLRSKFQGQAVQSDVLSFTDTLQNPYHFFRQFFGEEAVKPYEREFMDYFENQTVFALTGLTPDIVPSFLIVMRPKGAKSAFSEKFIEKFIRKAMGEEKSEKRKVGSLSVNYGKTTGLYYYLMAGLYLISDSRSAVEASAKVFGGKTPSVWDLKDNAKLRDLMDKPSAIYINLADLSDRIYDSMLKKMKMNSAQKKDMKTFMRTFKNMGSLVGYGENKASYNYYYLVLKKDKK